MNYSELKAGVYIDRSISDDEMWSAFFHRFSPQTKDSSSYKYGFLKSILDNLYNVDEELKLSFFQLFSTFAESYWNLVLKYGIRQQPQGDVGKITYVESILKDAEETYMIAGGVPFESIHDDAKIKIISKVKNKCKNNVVGSLYGATLEYMYSFSVKDEWIQFNPRMYEFMCKNKLAIEKMNYYEWARYLEKINEDSVMDHLLTKIDESTEKTRSSLDVYRKILFEEFESHTCFYCGKPITNDGQKTHVDHFVPWSFIKDDKMWNFVLACNTCNSKKSDRLVPVIYLERLIQRNTKIVASGISHQDMKTYKQDNLRRVFTYWERMNSSKDIWIPASKNNVV